jgi:hypothetical protein
MPTTIFDSSLLTQRRRDNAKAGSFLNRIQNPTQPQTGYAPARGIYDQSIVTDVKVGNMPFFRKANGVTTVMNGCPCLPVADSCQ